MNRFFRKIHRWLGFPLGLLFLVTFSTGLLTSIDELWSRSEYSQFVYRETSLSDAAAVLTRLTEKHKDIRQIVMPTPDTPYYQVHALGKTFTYPLQAEGNVPLEKSQSKGFFDKVLQLHRNFLLGKEGLFGIGGAHFAAWTGLIALVLSLIGFWLWWPTRHNFKMKNIWPKSFRRSFFYNSHTTGGVVILLLIVFMALSGATITYRGFTENIFGISRENVESGFPVQRQIKVEKNWYAWLFAASEALPGAKLMRIQFPRKGNSNTDSAKILTFRFLNLGDWLGLPSSAVKIDADKSLLLNRSVFAELPMREKIFYVLKPLHTGRGLPLVYVVILIVLSSLGVLMVFSGVLSFALKKRRYKRTRNIVLRNVNDLQNQ